MSVDQNLEEIMSARFGKDVRQSIHDAICDINEVAKRAEFDASTAPASAKAYAEAALASEQAAQSAKQSAEEAAQQAMSGTPAGYADLVEEVRSLKASNDIVLVEAGTFGGRVLLDKMYGMSIQNGIPTPSVPVTINSAKANFRNNGKNFINLNRTGSITEAGLTFTWNEDGSVVINGTSTAWQVQNLNYISMNTITIPPGTYKISGGAANVKMNIRSDVASIAYLNDFTNDTQVTIPENIGGSYCRLEISENQTFNNVVIKPMIRLASVSDDTYEPYQGQSVTTDLVLRAIEVTSSDDYNLVKDGKYYVADTLEKIDGGYQITRRIGETTVGDLTWEYAVNRFRAAPPSDSAQPKSRGIPAICTHYVNSTSEASGTFWFNNFNYYNIKYIVIFDNAYTDASSFKTARSDASIEYQLKTPTIETVSNADAKKLLSLKSYDEATYVAQTEDTEGVMALKYGSTELSNMAVTGYVEGEQNSIRLSDLESAV